LRALGVSCHENNLSLNVNKIKEMIVDFRKQQREHNLSTSKGTAVEKVEWGVLVGESTGLCQELQH
jgi:hypothetical protein